VPEPEHRAVHRQLPRGRHCLGSAYHPALLVPSFPRSVSALQDLMRPLFNRLLRW
jgi:hypothetical protein